MVSIQKARNVCAGGKRESERNFSSGLLVEVPRFFPTGGGENGLMEIHINVSLSVKSVFNSFFILFFPTSTYCLQCRLPM